MAAMEADSDSSGARRYKKRTRKEIRREVRENRESDKTEDPFLYYFGRADPIEVKA